MQQQLINQAQDGLKAMGQATIEMIKLMAALLNLMAKKIQNCETQEDKAKVVENFTKQADDLLKGKLPVGEFSAEVKDCTVMEVPDEVVSDMLETELLTQGFDFSRMSNGSFAVRGGDVEVINKMMTDTAKKLDGMKDMPKEAIKTKAKEELKLAKKGFGKDKIEKKLNTQKKVKTAVKNFKEKAEKKNHDRERSKAKTKDRGNAER